MANLINYVIADIEKNYKIDRDKLEKVVAEDIAKTSLPHTLELSTKELSKIVRTGDYKNFIKRLKKGLYFSLRTYKRDEKHVSSLERQPYIANFIEQIDKYLASTNTLLDLGGGMFAAQFPFDSYPKLVNYTWLDKDKDSYSKLLKYAQDQKIKNLNLVCEPIGNRNFEQFDTVLMLKLIPVIARQEKELLEYLSRIPAKIFVITGSKEAMVKRIDIQKREDTVIKSFIAKTSKMIVSTIDIENEFGYIIS